MTATIMPRARLLMLNGYGHGTFLTSSCTAQAVERYLVEVALPAPGTVREPDFQPFDVPPTASAGTRGTERRRFLSGPLTPR